MPKSCNRFLRFLAFMALILDRLRASMSQDGSYPLTLNPRALRSSTIRHGRNESWVTHARSPSVSTPETWAKTLISFRCLCVGNGLISSLMALLLRVVAYHEDESLQGSSDPPGESMHRN